jgi:HEAT repeat protein
MTHVFISHAHEDADFASLLISHIRDAGFMAWVDGEKIRIGKDWRHEIDAAIREAFALVVIVSPQARASEYVTYEWAYALGIGVEIIPILLSPTELHPRLEVLQYLNFSHRLNRPWDTLIARLQELSTVEHRDRNESLDNSELSRLLDHLHTSWEEARGEAADTLGIKGYTLAVPALIKTLRDSNGWVRSRAAVALGRIGDPSALSALAVALHDRDQTVRESAADALEKFGAEANDAVPDLIKVLQYWEQPSVQEAAARALGAIGNEAAIPALVQALNYGKDNLANPPEAAARALLRIGTPEALDALKKWVAETSDPDVNMSKLAGI